MSRKTKKAEAHVRIYRHELDCPAYRILSCAARALLVEMRALYSGCENRIFMSREQAERRLGAGRRVAERALAELVKYGWLRVREKGSFHRKIRHATVYALTNVPLEQRDGATAPKDFMRWTPDSSTESDSTVEAQSKNHAVQNAPHRGTSRTTPGDEATPNLARRGAPCTPPAENHLNYGVRDVPTDKLPGGTTTANPFLIAALCSSGESQLLSCLNAVLLGTVVAE